MIKNSLVKAIDTLREYQMIFMLLFIYIVTIPVMKTPNLPLLARRIQFSEVVFIFLFFLWIKALIRNKRLPQDTGLNKPFLLFIAFCLLSFFNSTNLFISTLEILGLIYLFIMLIMVVDIVDNKRKLDTVIKVWIGTLTVVLLLGFIGLCTSVVSGKTNPFCCVYYESFPYFKVVYRVSSVFRLGSGLANYLVVSLGFVVSDLLLAENKRYKVFLKIVIFFMGLITIATVSGDIVAFMLSSLLIYNYFHKKKDMKFRAIRFTTLFLIMVLFLGLLVFNFLFHVRSYKIENFFKGSHRELVVNIDYTYASRLAQRLAALEMIKRHPFLGVGLAMYPSYQQKLSGENYFKNLAPIYFYNAYVFGYDTPYLNFLPPTDPHNDTLQYLAETGILGGGAFILFIAAFLYLIYTNMRKRSIDQYFKVRLFCFLASFIGVLIESMGMDVFKARHLWFLMALTLALIMMHKDKQEI